MRAPTEHDIDSPAGRLSGLLRAVGLDLAYDAVSGADELLITPNRLRDHLERIHCGSVGGVLVTGTLDRRLVLVERPDSSWLVADLSGQPHATRRWPGWLDGHLELTEPESWLSPAGLDAYALKRLSRPRMLLAALYHPEYFPLPRFPLGISDLARAARATLVGEVVLADMQLGTTLFDLIQILTSAPPDVSWRTGTATSGATRSTASATTGRRTAPAL